MITEVQDTRDIQFVRAVWGNFDSTIIPQSPQFNEVVYVWGIENKTQLDSLGYTTVLCDRNKFNFKYTSHIYTFMHKILALIKANTTYSKFIFLDWDVNLIKNMDDSFFNYLNTKNFLVPLYSYDKSSFDDISITVQEDWLNITSVLTPKFSWEYENMYLVPNASFIYVNNSDILDTLNNIVISNGLKCLIEEYAINILTNCSLSEYMESYYPKVCKSSSNETLLSYVSSNLDTDIYFENPSF